MKFSTRIQEFRTLFNVIVAWSYVSWVAVETNSKDLTQRDFRPCVHMP